MRKVKLKQENTLVEIMTYPKRYTPPIKPAKPRTYPKGYTPPTNEAPKEYTQPPEPHKPHDGIYPIGYTPPNNTTIQSTQNSTTVEIKYFEDGNVKSAEIYNNKIVLKSILYQTSIRVFSKVIFDKFLFLLEFSTKMILLIGIR